jgi:hypothetical protein
MKFPKIPALISSFQGKIESHAEKLKNSLPTVGSPPLTHRNSNTAPTSQPPRRNLLSEAFSSHNKSTPQLTKASNALSLTRPPTEAVAKSIGTFLNKALNSMDLPTASALLQISGTGGKASHNDFADFTNRAMSQLPGALGLSPTASGGELLVTLVSHAPGLKASTQIADDLQFGAIAVARTVLPHLLQKKDSMTNADLEKLASTALQASLEVESTAHKHDIPNPKDSHKRLDNAYQATRHFFRGFKKDSTSNQALKLATECIAVLVDKEVQRLDDSPVAAATGALRLDDKLVAAATNALLSAPTRKGKHISGLYNTLIKGLDTQQRQTLDQTLNKEGRLGLATRYQSASSPKPRPVQLENEQAP